MLSLKCRRLFISRRTLGGVLHCFDPRAPVPLYLFSIFLRAPFLFCLFLIFFFFDHQGNGAFSANYYYYYYDNKRQTLPIRDSRPNCGEMEEDPVLACFMCYVNYLFINLMLNVPSLLWLLRWPPDPMQRKQAVGDETKRRNRRCFPFILSLFLFAPPLRPQWASNNSKALSKRRKKDWDLLYYMLAKTHTD